MKLNKFACALALAAVAPLSAQADLDYSYAEVDYNAWGIQVDPFVAPVAFDESGKGFNLAGSFAFGDHWFMTLDYRTTTSDMVFGPFPGTNEVTDYAAMAGFRFGIGESTDLFAKLGYESLEFTQSFPTAPVTGSADDGGASAVFGLRSQFGESFEFGAQAGYADLGDMGSITRVNVNGMYSFSESFGLVLAYDDFSGDGFGFGGASVGVRFGF